MEKAKIRPIAAQEPLTDDRHNSADVITSRTAPGMHNFVAIGSGVYPPQIHDFALHFDVISMFPITDM